MLLNQIEASTDAEETNQLLEEAFQLDHHDPRVLYLVAENTEDPYERLSLLDHSLRHARHDLSHLGFFSDTHVGYFASYPEGLSYVKSLALRLSTLMQIQYDFQATADLNEILYLDNSDSQNVRALGILLGLRINNFPLAQSIYDEFEDRGFDMDFPYAVLLHANGETESAKSILVNHLEQTPHFKTILQALVANEELGADLLDEAAEILKTIAEVAPYLTQGLIESLESHLD